MVDNPQGAAQGLGRLGIQVVGGLCGVLGVCVALPDELPLEFFTGGASWPGARNGHMVLFRSCVQWDNIAC